MDIAPALPGVDVPAASPPVISSSAARRARAPLVGRERELGLVRDLIAAARGGTGRLLFLVGEAGIGKTRLVEALEELAAEAGCLAVVGRAFPAEGSFPFAIAADALAQLVRALGPAAVSVLSRGAEDELAVILPTLARPERGPARRTPDADGRARLFWHVAQFLRRAAAQQPIVLVLENAQWADASSLALLHFLLRQLDGARVAALCTYNVHERNLAPALRATERSLRRAGLAEIHELAPLGITDVALLAQRALALSPDVAATVAARLHRRTLGNPFFVEEMLKAIPPSATAARIPALGGAAIDELSLPTSVREAVLARIDAVGDDARSVLDIVGVSGARVPRSLLETLCPLPADAFAQAVALLCARGLLVEHAAEGALSYECDHPIVQATLYEALGHTRAQALHGAVARAYEALHDGGAGSYAHELAWHYSRSGDLSSSPKAVKFLAQAGRDALMRHADREAVSLLQAALTLATTQLSDDPVGHLRLLDDLARARQHVGEYDAARTLWAQARMDAARHGDTAATGRFERRMGLCAFLSGRPREAIGHYDAAITTSRGAGDLTTVVRTLVARGTALQSVGESTAAKASAMEALALAETMDDPALLARVYRALLLLFAWTGPAERARAYAARALEYGQACGDRTVEWSAHWGMAVLAGFTGDGPLIAAHLTEAERLAADLGSPVIDVWTGEIAIEHASAIGDWNSGLELADRVLPVARAVAARTVLPRLLVWKGIMLLAQDRLEEAKACFDESWERAGVDAEGRHADDVHAVIPAHTGRAAYYLEIADYVNAIRYGERGLALAEQHGYLAWSIHRLLPVILEASLWIRDFDRATRLSARLRADSLQLDHRLGLAWADAADALVLHLRDASPLATAALLRAAGGLEQVPFVFHAARLRRKAAECLSANGDREGALAELRRAHGVFLRLGAERELRGTRQQIRALGARPPQRVVEGEGVLTTREQQIARLLAERKTNKEIGLALDISSRTVGTHLSNIFQKLGVDSRGALVDQVREDSSLLGDPPAAASFSPR